MSANKNIRLPGAKRAIIVAKAGQDVEAFLGLLIT